ncbi:MAG: hypothetical protein KC543_16135 [Myxococcales bacterium]|nr:hypothetical protein [Myxococcales bacterium]
MHLSLLLFALAAAVGLWLATRAARARSVPTTVAVLHGLLAGGGIVALFAAIARGAPGRTGMMPTLTLAVFIVAAIVGLILFGSQLRRRPLSMPLIVIHAVAALSALALLALAAMAAAPPG